MTHHLKWKHALGLSASGLAMAAASALTAETFVGKTVESRVLLGFRVDDAAIAAFLPEGWAPVTLPQGPVAGSNLIVALIDRHLYLDADGTPDASLQGPTVAMMAYGRNPDIEGVRGFVVRVYEQEPIADPYGTSVAVREIVRDAGWYDAGQGDRRQQESWTVTFDDGAKTVVTLDATGVDLNWSSGESRPYSPVTADFFRIYRYDQLAGLAMNAALGRTLDGAATFETTDPGLISLFDGSETLSAIVSIPTYVREISLP